MFAIFVTAPARADAAEILGDDKVLHLGASAAATILSYGVSSEIFESPVARLLFTGCLGVSVGGVKELVDLVGPGAADWRDMVWNLVGVGVGLIVAALVEKLRPGRRNPAYVRRGALGGLSE